MSPGDRPLGGVLGVDPGLAATGWGVLRVDEGGEASLVWGVIRPPRQAPRAERLAAIRNGLIEVIDRYAPAAAAVEQPFLKTNVKTAVALGQAQAAAFLAAADRELPVTEYAPREVKQAVAGDGNAEKAAVARALQTRLGLEDFRAAEDAGDALAVAFCHYLLAASALEGPG